MAAEQKERTARLAERRQELGEQELRHTVQPGTRKKLADMMAWYGVEEVSEAVQLLVMNAKPQEIPPAPPRQPGKSETIRHYFRQGMPGRPALQGDRQQQGRFCGFLDRQKTFEGDEQWVTSGHLPTGRSGLKPR